MSGKGISKKKFPETIEDLTREELIRLISEHAPLLTLPAARTKLARARWRVQSEAALKKLNVQTNIDTSNMSRDELKKHNAVWEKAFKDTEYWSGWLDKMGKHYGE